MEKYHVNTQNFVADDEMQNNIGLEVCRTCKDCIYVGLGKLNGQPVYNASFCKAYSNKPSEIVFENKDTCPYKKVR